MTFPNRISFAGAIPALVAIAFVALLAAVLIPARPASATPSNGTCDLSPVLLDMLLARYDMKERDCNELNYATAATAITTADIEADTWDFSNKDLTEFAISDDDADRLRILESASAADADPIVPGDSITEEFVRYIDLTGNPLTVDDVSFKHIPSDVAIILSADSNVAGFQQSEYTVTEGAPGYISMAFPNLFADGTTDSTVTVDVTGDVGATLNSALTDEAYSLTDTKIDLVVFGTGTGVERTLDANSEADDVIFYWPITVRKDNDNSEDWDVTFAVTEDVAGISGSLVDENNNPDIELANDEAEITVLDADAPALNVEDRSEDVREAILALATADGVGTQFGGHTRADDLTLRDLGTITALTVTDADDDDREAIESLVAGDLEGLVGLRTLHIVGARSLPSGIFAGVGSKATIGDPATDTTVQITFAQNAPPSDSDADKVGDFKPSTIPSHIWEDQEPRQVIVLTDDVNDKKEGVTSGFDSDLYAGVEGEYIYVLTNASTSAWILGNSVTFGTTAVSRPVIDLNTTDAGNQRGGGPGNEGSKVVRFAVKILPDNDKDDGDRNTWLFLFDADTDANSPGTDEDPANVGQLKDVATVAVTDDD